MKRIILTTVFLLGCLFSFGQSKKMEIVCEVFQDQINYGGLLKFLPDSLQKQVIVSFKKNHGLAGVEIINVLCLNGWSLVTVSQKVDNTTSLGTYSNVVYHLKREITVTDQEFIAIQARIHRLIK